MLFEENMQAGHIRFLCSPPASTIIVLGMLGSTSLLIPFSISLWTCSPLNRSVSFPVCWPTCFQNLCWQQIPEIHYTCYIKKVFPFIFSKPISCWFQWLPPSSSTAGFGEQQSAFILPLPWFYKSSSYPLSPNWSSCCGYSHSLLFAPWEYGMCVWVGLSLRFSLPSLIHEQGPAL